MYAAEEILRITNQNIPSRVLTFRELSAATNNFSCNNLVGEGGFGMVYKGHFKDTKEVTTATIGSIICSKLYHALPSHVTCMHECDMYSVSR